MAPPTQLRKVLLAVCRVHDAQGEVVIDTIHTAPDGRPIHMPDQLEMLIEDNDKVGDTVKGTRLGAVQVLEKTWN